jgi:hypothetical protein
VFWGGKRPWVECGGSIRKHSVPKFELDSCPDHWGSQLGLKLHETSSYAVYTRFASKKEHFQDFCSVDHLCVCMHFVYVLGLSGHKQLGCQCT